MKVEIIATKDGSHSLFREDLNETYHSTHGAEAESRYVFMKMGLDYLRENNLPIRILEVGFGTGLNALLALEYQLNHKVKIEYHTLEPFPLSAEIYEQLNYTDTIQFEGSKAAFSKLHSSSDNEEQRFGTDFLFTKYYQKLEDFNSNSPFTVIFFDAFAPSKQADMWTIEQLQHVYNLTDTNGVFTTYCAQGQFKRNLKAVGYETEELPGPPGKKEMTRGRKII